ncbi:transglycosylase domain-containing protein [Streptomyces sp. HNS054]|uniref:transglycosylase domain-containing protein n=1 Tax=Streptomyces sp. HNS054 TaxID=1662446 RepID=UPI000652CC95|nr:transglycosylase domain-containing protein [Streptomyces sp. HNS054]WPW19516.1 transglycosylase domain-containing protein [Streptomyces griseoincarnatus]
MSDEPQPKKPRPGWASHEPRATDAPDDARDDTRPDDADATRSDEPDENGGATTAAGQESDAASPKKPGAATDKKAAREERRAALKARRTGWRRAVPTWRMVLGAFLVTTLLLVGGFLLGYALVQIPAANALATQQANVYLYADGSVIARDGEVNRENVTLSKISKDAQHAVLAAEDRDFYTESAVDPLAMARGAWNTVTGKGKQSGSTITQQYVKNYYLRQEQTVTRKVKEFFIAIKLDRNQSKDEILEGYLNTSFFGRGAYGIQAAAHAYYDMDASELDAGRAAYLAALVNAPSQYDVIAHPENRAFVEDRWNYVLDGMVDEGWLDPAERARLTFPVPNRTTHSTGMSGQRGYIVNVVKQHLTDNKIVDEASLDTGGYRITTTLQKDKQDAFVESVNENLMDRLDQNNRKVDTYVRAGGASVEPKTGKVVAMYNGVDYVKQYTPNATRRDFQTGSSFKPFVLTAAIENDARTQDGRRITPQTRYDGTSERPVQGWAGPRYAPENEDHEDYGDITVSEATDKSVNAVYAQMAVDVGPDKVRQTAVDLGISPDTPSLDDAGPSIALGVASASVLDMAQAYATLANHGKHTPYTLVEEITQNGRDIALPERRTRQAVSREAADTTTSVLKGVVENGTGTAAQTSGRPAAGKTGTAEEDTAAWFAGYTPDLATVVAVMGQDPVTAGHKSLYGAMGLPRVNGGGAPAEIWGQYTRDALKGKPVSSFNLRLQPGANESQPPAPDSSGGPSSSDDPSSPATGAPDDEDTDSGTPEDDSGNDTGDDGTESGNQDSTGGTSTGSPTGGQSGDTGDGGGTGTGGGEDTTGGSTDDGGSNRDELPGPGGLSGALDGRRWN